MAELGIPSSKIDFGAPLWNPGSAKTIAYAEQVVDRYADNKNQTTINADTLAALTRLEKLAKAGIVL